MLSKEKDPGLANQSPLLKDYAEVWQAANKIVYSTSLDRVFTARTRIARRFDPRAILRLKRKSQGDILIGSPGLASYAFAAGLIDRCHIYISPVVVGGGKPGFLRDLRLDFQLKDMRPFDSGVIFLRYKTDAP